VLHIAFSAKEETAMAVTGRDLYPQRRTVVTLPSHSTNRLAYWITTGLALLVIYVLLSSIVGWGQTTLDDIRYGRPRTFQLSAEVGHENGSGAPTQLIALNLNRQVMVIEIPGGDATQTRTLVGPYLFGAGEDLTPVKLRLEDLNRDNAPDLIVSVKDEEMVYINRDNQFQLITPEERLQIIANMSATRR